MSDDCWKNRPKLPAVDEAFADADNFIGLFLRRWRMVRDTHHLCYLVSKLTMVNIGDLITIRIWATDIMDVYEFSTLLSLFLALAGVIVLQVNIRRELSRDRIVGPGTSIRASASSPD